MKIPHIFSRLISIAFAALFLEACGIYISSPGGGFPKHETDQEFIDQVLQEMPNFELTSEMIGRPLKLSPVFAFAMAIKEDLDGYPDEQYAELMSMVEETGIGPSILMTYTKFLSTHPKDYKYWKLQFPGCEPTQCQRVLDTLEPVEIDMDEFYNYRSSSRPKYIEKIIKRATIQGVEYYARLNVYYDAFYRAVKYRVHLRRAPVTEREQAYIDNLPFPMKDGGSFPVLVYSRNLVLDIDFTDRDPVFDGTRNSNLGL